MMPIQTVFGVMVVLFGLVGGLRGWAKEIIVVCSVIVALFFQHVLLTYVPPLLVLFEDLAPQTQFYIRAILFIIIAVFGYASPSVLGRLGSKVARERLQDILLGFFIGLLNGFLIIGTLYAFLDAAHYGVPEGTWHEEQIDGQTVTVYNEGVTGIGGIEPPKPKSTAHNLLAFMPPTVIQQWDAALYLAVAVAFVFVLIVFI